jgi:hypothetical protein
VEDIERTEEVDSAVKKEEEEEEATIEEGL